jgi:outer membrane protein assembly factor BamB
VRFDVLILKSKLLITKLLAILILSSGVGACSSTDDEDPQDIVAELIEFEKKFEPNVLWNASVGNGVGNHFSRIKPAVAYNKVFAASRDGDVIAFEQVTGKELWRADLSDIDSACPTTSPWATSRSTCSRLR